MNVSGISGLFITLAATRAAEQRALNQMPALRPPPDAPTVNIREAMKAAAAREQGQLVDKMV
jgi:hypothetical protein